MSKNNASLWSEIGWPILRDWGPDRKQVVYLTVDILRVSFIELGYFL